MSGVVELIELKRDGGTLSPDQIDWLIAAYTAGEVADYQMAALLMAIVWRGLSADELAAWTRAMLHSGEVLDFSDLPAPKVDKHSTGGVGDKVSIPLAPMVAACGVAVPMMSGRGLGHTGGTLDKLESIAGFSPRLDPPDFRRILGEHGMVMAGQSETLAPADRRIYALRDATGTVPSIPLIASSIMSKKLAEGIDSLVLDVKVGRGAFMKDVAAARDLAETMVGIGRSHDTRVVAVLTAMDQPLGRAVGNANEIEESVDVLRGGGPPDVVEVTFRLGAEMLLLAGLAADETAARALLADAIASGAALDKLGAVIAAQGGDRGMLHDPSRLPRPEHRTAVPAPRAGYVTRCDALAIGRAAVRLGAGRSNKEDGVDPAVGLELVAKLGDRVEPGDPLGYVGWNDEARLAAALELLEGAWTIGDEPGPDQPLILGEVR